MIYIKHTVSEILLNYSAVLVIWLRETMINLLLLVNISSA